MTTRQQLINAGKALYGDDWQEPLADDLAVNIRSLQRWASGARDIPSIGPELAALCHERARSILGMDPAVRGVLANDALVLSRLALELGYEGEPTE